MNIDNFVRAETDRMFVALQHQAGGVNSLFHHREPAPLDAQPVIRQNRDTLYSLAVVDISAGATLTVPDSAGRYLSVMVVNEDHFINRVFHDAGVYELMIEEFDTDYVLLAVRILVNPNDPDDVATVNALQDQFALDARSARAFVSPECDRASFDETREALLVLNRNVGGTWKMFGRREDVDPVRHLIGTASGWGGLPESEAFYLMVDPGLPVGEYSLDVGDVPVDAFWSISVYNQAGYFESHGAGRVSINSVTADRNDDGTITVRFGDGDAPNTIGIMPGWNYAVRLYQPHAEVVDGSWTFPSLTTQRC